MAGSVVKSGSVISIVVLLAAYFYKRQSDEALQQHLREVLSGLLRAENKVTLPEEPKVAVGFGACQDIFSNAVDVLEKIGAVPPTDPTHVNEIMSREDLERGFAYFFQHGAAAERYVKNATLFEELVRTAASLKSSRWALGGNAPVMAQRFQMEGCKVLLGAVTSTQLREQIQQDIQVVGGSLMVDDIHLLLEYQRGEEWGDKLQAPRANRYIVHSDKNNPFVSSLEEFVKEMENFSPTLLVIGGLQMLDNFPFDKGEREDRLSKVKSSLANLPSKTRVHFEMASFAEEACLLDILENVARYSDSLGMNEQELPNLHSILTNGSVTLISDPYPRIATTLDHMRAVYELLQDTTGKQRPLTRLHVHTLAYQAIMTTKGSSWKNSMSAAAKSSLVANRHTCGNVDIDAQKARLLMDDSFLTSREENGERIPLNPERPVACWEETIGTGGRAIEVQICIAPVLVCTDVVQTGGGGDNISSAGLVLQI